MQIISIYIGSSSFFWSTHTTTSNIPSDHRVFLVFTTEENPNIYHIPTFSFSELIYPPLPLIFSVFLSIVTLPFYDTIFFRSGTRLSILYFVLFWIIYPLPIFYIWRRFHAPRPSLQYLWLRPLLYSGLGSFLINETPSTCLYCLPFSASVQYLGSSLGSLQYCHFFNEIPLPLNLYLYNWPRPAHPLSPGIKKSPNRTPYFWLTHYVMFVLSFS